MYGSEYFFEDNFSTDLNFWASDGYFEEIGTFPLYESINLDVLEDVIIIYQNQQQQEIEIAIKINTSSQQSTGFKIPPPPEPLQFDKEEIVDIKSESKKVTAMLNPIYEQEQPLPPVTEPQIPEPQSTSSLSLDAVHIEIVKTLATRDEWERNELATIMKGMMIDGVIEHINEAFLDYFEVVFVEGYNPVEINVALYKEIFK